MSVDISVRYGGVNYVAEIGTVRSTRLGYEDHGILTCWLDLDFDGSGQGFGGRGLDQYDKLTDSRVIPNGYGLDFITQVISVAGVRNWEDVKGAKLLALREQPFGFIVGIADLQGDRVLIAQDHANTWYPVVTK